MNKETRSGLIAIKSLLGRDPCIHANTAIQMIDAMLAEQPAQQEPVAWMQEMPTQEGEARSVRLTTLKEHATLEWDNPIPLYAAPQPPAQQSAERGEPVPSIIQMLGHCPECGAKAHHFTKGNT